MPMCEVKLIKANGIIPVVKELLEDGKRVRITVTGMSMYPFLREHKDSVELIKVDMDQIRLRDIILIKRDTGEYILHRVIKKSKNTLYLNGDAQQWCEGPIRPEQIIGKVAYVWRQDLCIPCTNKWWIILSFCWRILLRVRYPIIRTYRFMRKIWLLVVKFG